jgi:ribosome-associated protein
MAHKPKEKPHAETVRIRGEMIRLGQLLKLTNVVGTGSEVKALLATEHVIVNGEAESRRGRQLHPGDVVKADGRTFEVTARF